MPGFLWGLSGRTSLVAYAVSFPTQAEEVKPSAMAKLFCSIWVYLSCFSEITSTANSLDVYVHGRRKGKRQWENKEGMMPFQWTLLHPKIPISIWHKAALVLTAATAQTISEWDKYQDTKVLKKVLKEGLIEVFSQIQPWCWKSKAAESRPLLLKQPWLTRAALNGSREACCYLALPCRH